MFHDLEFVPAKSPLRIKHTLASSKLCPPNLPAAWADLGVCTGGIPKKNEDEVKGYAF